MLKNAQAVLHEKNHRIEISGVLNFETVVALWEQSLPLFKKYSEVTIDLAQDTSANTAGLALLLEWRKWSLVTQQKLSFANVPTQLQSMAKFTGIEF